jgi:hypothetical protein
MKRIRFFAVTLLAALAVAASACTSPTGPDHTLGGNNHTLGSNNEPGDGDGHTLGSNNHTLGGNN